MLSTSVDARECFWSSYWWLRVLCRCDTETSIEESEQYVHNHAPETPSTFWLKGDRCEGSWWAILGMGHSFWSRDHINGTSHADTFSGMRLRRLDALFFLLVLGIATFDKEFARGKIVSFWMETTTSDSVNHGLLVSKRLFASIRPCTPSRRTNFPCSLTLGGTCQGEAFAQAMPSRRCIPDRCAVTAGICENDLSRWAS